MRIALVTPGRTSSGGDAFSRNLAEALTEELGIETVRASAPVVGRIELGSDVTASTHVVFIGSRAVPVPTARTVFWPLNVAPFEKHVVRSEASSAKNRARHVALVRRLRRSVGSVDGLVFGSYHARTLYQSTFAAGAELPYRVIRGGTPSGVPILPRAASGRPQLVVSVSHLYPYKGTLEFVEAIGLARDEIDPDVRFRIAGADRDTTYAAAVRRRIAELGIGDRVEVAPATVDELGKLYAEADLAVFTSTCENAGSFALFDGLHAGVPTISSDRSSMPEMVAGSVRLVNPFEPVKMAEAMVEVLGDHALREQLADRALAWSAAAPTWRQRAEQLVSFLEELEATR